ncbi:MAG TPA: GNAT family N-acetyltransferase [Myxococcales bacterium]|nr:GNAT family N-acetyltransferase [Myxococcales bacterium]HIK85016.1 GNAT family N-acetyltransferase [Myxococcales bacterium]
MLIRDYDPEDANEVADLFHDSVHGIDSPTLSPAQLEAWAPTPPDYPAWRTRLTIKMPYLACSDGKIIGFIELEADGHIDCFYTHADHQRQGVGAALYAHLLAQAGVREIVDLYVEASEIARPFFEKSGFALGKRNRIERGGEILTNYSMTLKRSGGSAEGGA